MACALVLHILFKLNWRMKTRVVVAICLLAWFSLASTINRPVSLAVTVYNNQFAIVKDVREISFDKGRSDLYFTDVSTNIQTQTVSFKALKNSDTIKVFEQNYEANLINTNSILKKYINNNIELVARVGSSFVKVNGTLLGYNSGYILKTKNGIQVFNNIDSINFASLPPGFLTLPTLNWKVYSDQQVTTSCEVAYRTTGFSWKADYSVTLNNAETLADIGGWVTIDNNSGKRYENAKLKLIAGDVNTVSNQTPNVMYDMAPSAAMSKAAAPSFSQKSFSDYHMYTLSETVTLNQNSQKQVQFIPKANNVRVRKYNLISVGAGGYSQANLKAANKIQFSNSRTNKLGLPLPKGTVRVFKTDDADNSLEFLGQDSIDHTPKDENITLNTGNAFDITANKVATNYRSSQNAGYTADLNLTVFNHKNIAAEIVIELSNYYGDNNQISWATPGLNIQRVSSTLLRVSKVFMANEQFLYAWSQNYRP